MRGAWLFKGRRGVWLLVGAIIVATFVSGTSRKRPETPAAEDPGIRIDTLEARGQIIEDFSLEGFDREGNRVWRLEGDLAHVDSEGDIFIEKDITLEIRGKTRIESDKVLWQSGRQRFITNQPVRVTHEGTVIQGRGALGKLDEEFVQINQGVRTELERGTILTCRGPVKIYDRKNTVTYYRDVVVTDPEGRLLADQIDIRFDQGQLEVEEVIATNNVQIEREGDTTFSEMAIYNAVSKSVKLVGEAEIRARGSHATTYLKS